MNAAIDIEQSWLSDFCRRYHVRRLSFFGSALTERFNSESDVDVLVEFDPGRTPGFFTIGGMMQELTDKLGRQADVRTIEDLGRGIREEALATAETAYVAD